MKQFTQDVTENNSINNNATTRFVPRGDEPNQTIPFKNRFRTVLCRGYTRVETGTPGERS